jgi:hypothetical protein
MNEIKIIAPLFFTSQSTMNEEPLVKVELTSSDTDPLLFRYSRNRAPRADASQDVFPFTCSEVQVRTAACFVLRGKGDCIKYTVYPTRSVYTVDLHS